MDSKNGIGRRRMLAAGAASLAGLPILASAAVQKNPDMIDPDAGVTAPEDLMKEHGVLDRCLLIYEENEHKVLGDEGFEKTVDKVASIEKLLGIYELAQFTPRA